MFTIPEAEGPNPEQWAVKHVGLVRNKIRSWHEQNGKCCFCRKDTWLLPFTPKGSKLDVATAEHFIPKSKGGRNNYHNICMSCSKCNQERDVMDAVEYWELHQDPKKLAAWRELKAKEKRAARTTARTKKRQRLRRQLSHHAKECNLTQAAFLDAIERVDRTVFEAHVIIQTQPWTFRPLCTLLKSCLRLPGVTGKLVLWCKSRLSRTGLLPSMSPTSRWQLGTP